MPYRSILLLALMMTSGCVARADYPSLLPRGTERQGFDEPAAPPPAPVVADPALDARIEAAQSTLRDASVRAEPSFARAERLATAARGQPAGSPAWLDAQVALADLDALRSDSSATLTDLEQVASERAATLVPDYPALTIAIAATRAAVAAQAARIAAIQAMLAPG